jgi:GNAT superfamily N-acetyltransferase
VIQPVCTDPRIRQLTPDDVATTVALVRGLAEYEKLADQCRMTEEQLHAALFGPEPALYGLAADSDQTPSGRQVGYALYFKNFSTFEGVHGIYLEDLYVEPEYRGTGLGKHLLRTLAATAVHYGYARVEWWVLKWNTPSIDFYDSLGAVPMDEWTPFRLTGPALARTAGGTA